jgi:hypothetical protein
MNANPEHDEWPQAGRKRLILPSPIGTIGRDVPDIEMQMFEEMKRGAVFMMGDNPALPRMPDRPTLLDFYRLRFGPIAYVDEEVAWAIRYHQALRYFADESVGYQYPEAYRTYFGADYEPPEYIRRDHDIARAHRWYMSSRLITLFDIYAFEPGPEPDLGTFEDIIGRNFRQPKQGLGFDGSPVAHMWRSMIWPNNFL